MASWLVIDWDQDHFHVLCAQSTRHGVQVTRAVSWPHPEPFTPSTAERVGKALRDFLTGARITNAPVLFGLGRDRVFLKELRVPEIAAHEEAGLVRFQTGKELTESVENYAVDYVRLESPAGERHVMTVAARRDIVTMIQTLCQTAGLRLHAITPRLFGTAKALERALLPEASPLTPNKLNAVLSIGQRWAELSFFKGRRLLQVQAMANGPLLAAEIKRNLAVFQAQHAVNLDLSGPEFLYVFSADGGTAHNGQQIPVRQLNPLQPEPELAEGVKNAASFAGAVGLADLFSSKGEKPVNLVSPKRQTAPISVSKQRGIILGAAAAAVLIFMLVGMWYVLYKKRTEIADLASERETQEKFMVANAQERAELDAYKDWEHTTVLWLDEMYDLSARHPWHEGFRVNQLAATSVGTKKNAKDGFVGKISLSGYFPQGKEGYLKNLNESMSRDTHVKPRLGDVKPGEFQMKIDIAKQDFSKYDTQLVVPVQRFIAVAPEPKKEETKDPDPGEGDPKDEGGDPK